MIGENRRYDSSLQGERKSGKTEGEIVSKHICYCLWRAMFGLSAMRESEEFDGRGLLKMGLKTYCVVARGGTKVANSSALRPRTKQLADPRR